MDDPSSALLYKIYKPIQIPKKFCCNNKCQIIFELAHCDKKKLIQIHKNQQFYRLLKKSLTIYDKT
jgi:hypothetical protein